MFLLMLFAMGMVHVTTQQRQAMRINHWHDVALRTAWAVDDALARYAVAPHLFPTGTSIMGDVDRWLVAALPVWQAFPGALHETTAWGGEVHVIMEAMPGEPMIFRLNALGHHPSGALLRKQWVLVCVQEVCRQVSSHAV